MNCEDASDDFIEVGPTRDEENLFFFKIAADEGESESKTIHSREKLLEFARKIIATYGDKASGPYR